MIGLGTLINVGAIIIGSTIGLLLKHNLKDKYKLVMLQGVGLSTIVMGLNGAITGLSPYANDKFFYLFIILSIVFGGIIGAYLKIEEKLNSMGNHIQAKFNNQNGNFSKGFVTASLIFCVGAMAIMGSISDGLSGDYSTLAIKAILDGITSMILASTLGIGVVFSFVPVLIYQGSLTILAHFFNHFLSDTVKDEMAIIGGILIIGIGLELAEIKKFKIADLLPAIFIPIILQPIIDIFINLF